MTAIAGLADPAERARLLKRLRELEDLGREMRRPGSLAAPAEPLPLHRSRHDDADQGHDDSDRAARL
jgi:hypothetical protein